MFFKEIEESREANISMNESVEASLKPSYMSS